MLSCAAAGHLVPYCLYHAIRRRGILKGYGPRRDQLEVVVLSQTAGSGKAYYTKDLDGKLQPLQIGNLLKRANHKKTKTKTVKEKMWDMIEDTIKKKASKKEKQNLLKQMHKMFSSFYGCLEKSYKDHVHLFKRVPEEKHQDGLEHFDCAVNFQQQSVSHICNHKDKPSRYPAILTNCNVLKEDCPYQGGELLLTRYGFVCNYSEDDVVMMEGDTTFHCVLPFAATCTKKFKTANDGQDTKLPLVRVSIIHYLNMNRE